MKKFFLSFFLFALALLLWPQPLQAANTISDFTLNKEQVVKDNPVNLRLTLDVPLTFEQHVSFLYKKGNSSPLKTQLCKEIENGDIVAITGSTYLGLPDYAGLVIAKDWTVSLEPGEVVVIAALIDLPARGTPPCPSDSRKILALRTVSLTVNPPNGGGDGDGEGGNGDGVTSEPLPKLPPPVLQNLTKFQDIGGFLGAVVNWLLALGGLVGLVILIWGGVEYITAGGNEEKSSKAKNTILGALIGIILIGASLAVITYVVGKVAGT